ncbi:hypothetical protein ACMFMG_009140 [Clarireedia jacksonii]
MATYGKKKKSMMPAFSLLRDSTYSKRKNRSSATYQMSAFHPATDSRKSEDVKDAHEDDSVDEQASELLDDTDTDQLRGDQGIGLSQSATTRALPQYHLGPPADKALPKIPSLIFNDDDAWALKAASVVTAAGSSNDIRFSDDSASREHLQNTGQPLSHSRKSSAPPIPRRSSKRRVALSKEFLPQRRSSIEVQGITRKPPQSSLQQSTMKQASQNSTSKPANSTFSAADAIALNQTMARIAAANASIKPQQQPLVVEKKRRLKGNKVFSKMKTVLSDRIRRKKQSDANQEDSLPDSPLVGPPILLDQWPRESGSLSDMEIILNEGQNIVGKQKVVQMTGNGKILRKRVHDDGRSLPSQWSSSSDPFLESPSLSNSCQPPTITEDQLLYHKYSSESSSPLRYTDSKLPTYPRCDDFDTSFDALFTSSPADQSTPRIRLEPTTDRNGTKKLQKVSVDVPSVFDHDVSVAEPYQDMIIDSPIRSSKAPQKTLGGILKNKSTNKNVANKAFAQSSSMQSMKKHPSPTKEELESYRRRLDSFDISYISPHASKHRHRDSSDIRAATHALKENIHKSGQSADNQTAHQKESGFPKKLILNRAAASLPAISHLLVTGHSSKTSNLIESIKSRAPSRVESRNSHRYSTRNLIDPDDSMMDTDELQ